MSFKNCLITKEYQEFENSILDKDCELPEDSFKIKFLYRSKYYFEIITDDELIKLIGLNNVDDKKIFYIIPWADTNVYEFTMDLTTPKDYVDFMYEPECLSSIIPPKHPYAITEGNIYIVDKEKSIAIVADRYYDLLYFYSNNPIKNLEERLIEYIQI